LHAYARTRSQDAFAQLVRRYINLVYSSARRQLRDSHLSEDVTQAVFLALSKKASSIPHNVLLSSWLLTATRYIASNTRLIESRRRHHETKAAAMANTATAPDHAHWNEIESALDEAMSELPAVHRDPLVLRYFDGKTTAEI